MFFYLSLTYLTVLLALACLGPIRDLWECKACSEQGPWEYSNWSAHLDHRCQVRGGQWQHTDGGEDHWQSNHFIKSQWGRDQSWAVDSGQSQKCMIVISKLIWFALQQAPNAINSTDMWQNKTCLFASVVCNLKKLKFKRMWPIKPENEAYLLVRIYLPNCYFILNYIQCML